MRSLFLKVFAGYLLVCFLLVAFVAVPTYRAVRSHYLDTLTDNLTKTAIGLRPHVMGLMGDGRTAELDSAVKDLGREMQRRITIVDSSGVVLADSENTREDVIELLMVPSSRVEVVYPGVGEAFGVIEDEQTLARTRDLYNLHSPFILSVGTLEPRKNLVTLLDAYATVWRDNGPEHKLVVAGRKGWLYEGALRRVEQLGLEDDVVFLGFVAEDHLPALYCLADLLVFPSIYEGFGLPPLEAMACGTPVITSDSSSLPEVVGDAGLMVPAEDDESLAEAIRNLLEDAYLREDLVRRGLSRAAEFTWEAAGAKLLEIYRRLDGDD